MPLTYFQLWMTRLMGLLPDVARCTVCREPLTAAQISFNTLGDGLFCALHRNGNASALSADSWLLAQRMLRAPVSPLPSKSGRGGGRRICAASHCKPWSGTSSASCARPRRWDDWRVRKSAHFHSHKGWNLRPSLRTLKNQGLARLKIKH